MLPICFPNPNSGKHRWPWCPLTACFYWCRLRDSNPRPPDYKSSVPRFTYSDDRVFLRPVSRESAETVPFFQFHLLPFVSERIVMACLPDADRTIGARGGELCGPD